MINSFSDFYNNLSSNGLFFFWIIIFLFVFVVFLVIVLLCKNRKLSKFLKEKNILENDNNILDTPINLDKNEVKKEFIEEIEVKEKLEDKKEEIKDEISKEINRKSINGLYKKNVLRDTRRQTSPISIDTNLSNEKYHDNEIDANGIDYNENILSPLETMDDIYEVNDSMRFASDIVEQMEEEIKPSNIELTDYEKKQEEEAIISYDELLKIKDRIYNITDDEETDEFIDELKNFRIDLQ